MKQTEGIDGVLLYCTKAKPFLTFGDKEGGFDIKKFRWFLYDGKPYSEHFIPYNGFVLFQCDCKEAFEYTEKRTDGRIYLSDSNISNFILQQRSCLTNEQLNCYGKGKNIFAYCFRFMYPIGRFPITRLFKDKACTIPMTSAPQSYCYAYRKLYLEDPTGCQDMGPSFHKADKKDVYWQLERYLVFSVKSTFMCKYGNGEKDWEVRTSLVMNADIACR